jgi:hypothetical protein
MIKQGGFMSGIGVVNLKKVAFVAGKVVGVTKKLIGKKGSLWDLIPIASELIALATGLVGVDFSALKSEITDIDPLEAKEVTIALIEGLTT